MQDTKVIKLLQSLNNEEFLRLGKFLRSPFFNYTTTIVQLFDHLKRYYPAFDSKKLEKEKVWKKFFPGTAFNDNKYWNLCFNFGKLVEKYLTVLQLEAQPEEEKKLLIRALGQRNVYDHFQKETKALIKQIDEQPYHDIHSYAGSLWLKHDYFFHPVTDKYGEAVFSVEDAMEELDRFYALAKLRFACEMKNRERIFSKRTPVHGLEESRMASSRYEAENPAFLLYRIVLELYDPVKGEAAFKEGKKILMQQFSKISKHDQNEVMLNLRNYAARQVNKGKSEFWRELLDLYKLGLKLYLIIDNGKINESAFANIVNAGCFEKEFNWTENFIIEYENYLTSEVREDMKMMSLGILYFEKKDFDKALNFLENRDFNNPFHQINVRLLMIKIWFEKFLETKSLCDLLNYKLDADEKFIRRNLDIVEQKKTIYINFILAVKQLVSMILQNLDIQEIQVRMEKYTCMDRQVASKKWLLEKTKQPY